MPPDEQLQTANGQREADASGSRPWVLVQQGPAAWLGTASFTAASFWVDHSQATVWPAVSTRTGSPLINTFFFFSNKYL